MNYIAVLFRERPLTQRKRLSGLLYTLKLQDVYIHYVARPDRIPGVIQLFSDTPVTKNYLLAHILARGGEILSEEATGWVLKMIAQLAHINGIPDPIEGVVRAEPGLKSKIAETLTLARRLKAQSDYHKWVLEDRNRAGEYAKEYTEIKSKHLELIYEIKERRSATAELYMNFRESYLTLSKTRLDR